MNRTQAIAKLKKLFGKAAAYRYDDKAPTAEQRAEAKAEYDRLKLIWAVAKQNRDAIRAELLKDPTYLKAVAHHDAVEKQMKEEGGRSRHYRVTIGRDGGLFFRVEAQADNWEEAFEKVEANRAARVKS